MSVGTLIRVVQKAYKANKQVPRTIFRLKKALVEVNNNEMNEQTTHSLLYDQMTKWKRLFIHSPVK